MMSLIEIIIFMSFHSSQFQGLCLTKSSRETLQNLSYFWKKKTQIVFSFFISSKIVFLIVWMSKYLDQAQVSQSRFNPKSAPMEDLGAVLKPNIEPKLDEYHLYFF